MGDENDRTISLRRGSAPVEGARPGERIGAWIVGERLGGGGFGEIYAAEHHETKQPAALKLLHAHFTAAPEMVARFDRETQILRRLRHPNIVDIVDSGIEAAGRPYLCMERLVGKDLGTILAGEHFEPGDARRIIEPLCDALATAHDLGIIHRDIKASNVFLCERDRRVVLLDFGIAKLLDALAAELTASHESLGTPGTMAPEQIHGLAVDARTDIYSLGALLFHLLTGRRPFHDPSDTMSQYLHLHARRPRVSALVPVSSVVDDVIMRSMAIDPNQRFGDVRTFCVAACNALRESPLPSPAREHTAILVAVSDLARGGSLDEALLNDLEAVLPAAERALASHGFTLALDLGSSAVFVAPASGADAVQTAHRVFEQLAQRPGRDTRVRVGIAVHRGMATVRGDRVEPCALLRPDTWGAPDPLDGVWASPSVPS